MLITLRQLLDHAAENGYGLPAFNINNLEQGLAILMAAEKTNSPVIIQASRGARAYAGDILLQSLIKGLIATFPNIPICMHQDHGNSMATCMTAMQYGFSSVMMDGSLEEDGKTPANYEYNVSVTSSVAKMAHYAGVSVEGELGILGSLETGEGESEDGHGVEGKVEHEQLLTDPDQAVEFVKATKVDALAIAMGTSHGAYKFSRKPDGEILAMVNQPSFNPNYRNQRVLDPRALRNRALTDVYEPGSTVKPLTVAAALETGKYSNESSIDTAPGSLKIGSLVVRDPSNRGLLNLDQVIAHSSQVGISKLALNVDAHEVRSLFDRIGIGKTLSIGFPGEETGSLPYFRRWRDIDRVTFAYGYGLTLTPTHLASAYMTIANDGLKRDLTLLRGGSSESTRVFSRAVAGQLKKMLSLVVIDGTGQKAKVDGYQVAGKTGTARKVGSDGYTDTNHLAFFAGLAPASQPKLVAVVLINDPQTARGGGGTIAAPVFSRVMTGALRILNIPPARKGSV